MKKVLGLLMASALIVSCSKDDNNNVSKVDMSKLTVGKWYFSGTKTTVAGQSVNQPYEHACTTAKDYEMYGTNGTLTGVEYTSDCNPMTYTDTYTLNGTSITSDGSTGTIKELSSSKLLIEYQETVNGVKFTYEQTYTAN